VKRPRAAAARAMALAALLAAGVAVVFAAACTPRAKKKTEVVFWQLWSPRLIQPLIREFEAQNPNLAVRVEELPPRTETDSVLAALASGRPPDLCDMHSFDMPRFLASGVLSDWTAGVADLKPGIRGWEMCSVGETIYGMPWVMDARALFYNRALFARAGLDSMRPPESWEELYRDAAAIQRLGHGVRGFDASAPDSENLFSTFMPLAWGNGGGILSANLDSVCFDTPENRQALAFFLSLRRVGMPGIEDEPDRAFAAGQLGLMVSSASLMLRIDREAPALRYGVAGVPPPARGRGTSASFGAGDVLVGFRASRQKEAALRLARFLLEPANALAFAAVARSVQPATIGADTAASYRGRPEQQVMIRQLELARFTPNHAAWDSMRVAIEEELRKSWSDRQSPPESVAARFAEAVDRRLVDLLGKR
jgi:ABC-type glycerol-3-phosphate transport system substrate-binding protein